MAAVTQRDTSSPGPLRFPNRGRYSTTLLSVVGSQNYMACPSRLKLAYHQGYVGHFGPCTDFLIRGFIT